MRKRSILVALGLLLAARAGWALGPTVAFTLPAQLAPVNPPVVEGALAARDGFGTTSAVYFFFSGPLDAGSLPASPVLSPSLGDAVFCANAATGTPVPITLKLDVIGTGVPVAA